MAPAQKLWRNSGVALFLRNSEPEMKKWHESYTQSDIDHKEELSQLSAMLEDDLSRRTLEKVLEYRRTWNKRVLKDIVLPSQYFQNDIFCTVEDEVFVDGGAFVGDTIEEFVKNFAGGGYKRIYAWEPDESNLATMKENTRAFDNIVFVPCGMWKEQAVLSFKTGKGSASKIVKDAEEQVVKVNVDSIDDVCSADKVTFIKMDIEGSEMAALEGAVNVIKRDKPRLAICVYHRPEDLYEIPFWIKRIEPEYKLYLRHHSNWESETVIYATL